MKGVFSTRRRSSSAFELGLLACCVALGSVITISAFGGEVVESYGAAARRLPRTTRARGEVELGLAQMPTSPTLEAEAVAIQRRLFGTRLADLIDDER